METQWNVTGTCTHRPTFTRALLAVTVWKWNWILHKTEDIMPHTLWIFFIINRPLHRCSPSNSLICPSKLASFFFYKPWCSLVKHLVLFLFIDVFFLPHIFISSTIFNLPECVWAESTKGSTKRLIFTFVLHSLTVQSKEDVMKRCEKSTVPTALWQLMPVTGPWWPSNIPQIPALLRKMTCVVGLHH